MKTDLNDKMEKLIGTMDLSKDEKWALKSMYLEIDSQYQFGLYADQEMANLRGALVYLGKAHMIDEDQEEDLWMLLNEYEAEGLKRNVILAQREQEEIINLRKRVVELTQALEEYGGLRKRCEELKQQLEKHVDRTSKLQDMFYEIRDKYTRMVGGPMELKEKYGGGDEDGTAVD